MRPCLVGAPFVELVDDLKAAYAPYCRNHDDVCALLERVSGINICSKKIGSPMVAAPMQLICLLMVQVI